MGDVNGSLKYNVPEWSYEDKCTLRGSLRLASGIKVRTVPQKNKRMTQGWMNTAKFNTTEPLSPISLIIFIELATSGWGVQHYRRNRTQQVFYEASVTYDIWEQRRAAFDIKKYIYRPVDTATESHFITWRRDRASSRWLPVELEGVLWNRNYKSNFPQHVTPSTFLSWIEGHSCTHVCYRFFAFPSAVSTGAKLLPRAKWNTSIWKADLSCDP